MTLTESFEIFWQQYPRKQGKAATEKIWRKISPSPELLSLMLEAVAAAKKSEQWSRDKGRYIPSPSKWLSQKRWEDKLDTDNFYHAPASYDLDAFQTMLDKGIF